MQINIMKLLSVIPHKTDLRIKFSDETTLSGRNSIDLQLKIRELGYTDALVYNVIPLYHARELYIECVVC